jgi:magnesium chelatase accessory protein
MPMLAQGGCRVLAMDLPGHAFTSQPPSDGLSLPAMAPALSGLLAELRVSPSIVVGHSAGAAILIRMALDGAIAPRQLMSLNGALLPFPGIAGVIFPPLAKLITLSPFPAKLMSWRARDRAQVVDLIEGTGSKIDARGLHLYQRLFQSEAHVQATLRMMASWDLHALADALPRLAVPLHLVVAGEDRAVAPEHGLQVRDRVPGAAATYLRGVGHLAHEERPREIADLILSSLA